MNINTGITILDEDDDEYINNNIKEENFIDIFKEDFTSQIRKRGLEYYENGNVLNVYKSKNKYIAKVDGSDYKPYEITLILQNNKIDYNCSCPCDYPCKHEYATLLAISNKEYLEVELKEIIKEKEMDLKNILESIPADEIKKYLLSPIGLDNVIFEMKNFSKYFISYYPIQGYYFYYNNLYNALTLEDKYKEITKDYLERIKNYIRGNKFKEVLNIAKAIIQAYNDTNKLNYDDNLIDMFLKLGMFLRITYRKSSVEDKKNLDEWINQLENKNFYDNYYLEDIMLSIK